MKILERLRNNLLWKKLPEEEWTVLTADNPKGWDAKYYSSDLSEITYYTCMKILTESLGKLSIHLKDRNNQKIYTHDAIKLLRVRPNPFMTPTVFKKVLEFDRNHYGNAYAYLQYDKKGNLQGIYPLEFQKVKIIVDNANILKGKTKYLYEYRRDNKVYYLNPEEILHFKGGISRDGILGRSVREELSDVILGAKESQKYLNNLYQKGLTAKAVLTYTGDLNREKEEALLNIIAKKARNADTGNIIPLPLGLDLKPIDIKLSDAQFFELKKFSALQIAAAFGVKPNHLNNYDKSSYANSEMQNLTFYIDTLLVILKDYEEEFNYKLLTEKERQAGYHFEFNVATILRGDLSTQAQALNTYVSGSIYKINEARQILGMPKIEDGDIIMVNGSYTRLNEIGKAYGEGGEKK